jgi:luciferase-type oxidoreductase
MGEAADALLLSPPSARGWNAAFQPGRLSLGLALPIEAYDGAIPSLLGQLELARLADRLGFAALWARDVPMVDSTFGDAGQVHDPWVWLGLLAGATHRIALATGALILPLRHAVHTAKAAASLQHLSGGRFIFGIGSGDRPIEYLAFGTDLSARGESFRAAVQTIRRAHAGEVLARAHGPHGLSEATVLPMPAGHRLPMMVTGFSQQSLDWIAEHADGWLSYPRTPAAQARVVDGWQRAVRQTGSAVKPFAQSFYLDLAEDADEAPTPIHLGLRLGRDHLLAHLAGLQDVGVNHVYFNLKFARRPVAEVLQELAEDVLPAFHRSSLAGTGIAL